MRTRSQTLITILILTGMATLFGIIRMRDKRIDSRAQAEVDTILRLFDLYRIHRRLTPSERQRLERALQSLQDLEVEHDLTYGRWVYDMVFAAQWVLTLETRRAA
ncbi:MAG TPA: hypothetical protein VLE72_00605 [Candidatus Saccharimonadales bacterium]|nr:hypothetical protein [Candidatus Saccharimonadales bacterium]